MKTAEWWRIDAFELWCWRRLLRVPWTTRRSNQSILKEINPEYSLEGLILKLKLQYFGHLIRRTDLLENTVMLGKIEGRKRRGWQRMRWLDDITDSVDMSLSKLREIVKGKETWSAVVHGITRSRTQLSNLLLSEQQHTFNCSEYLKRDIKWLLMRPQGVFPIFSCFHLSCCLPALPTWASVHPSF